ncbi:talin-1-like [Meleagris gallopavo]|uniref:talin-1-like n=1 Tax=Meleagris gallopavo TaxID=9103 RepID=UPI000549D8E7|nr:talin-1-like [Meleagris gallopavo]
MPESRRAWIPPSSDPKTDMLMQLAKAVASAAAALVLKAKNVAQKTEDSALQTQVIAAATQCALSTSQLVACTKVSTTPHLASTETRSLSFL